MRFCGGGSVFGDADLVFDFWRVDVEVAIDGVGDLWVWLTLVNEELGSLMLRDWEAGGPTGTIREPNSTPMVTSWWGENRPSQRRMVSCRAGYYWVS